MTTVIVGFLEIAAMEELDKQTRKEAARQVAQQRAVVFGHGR